MALPNVAHEVVLLFDGLATALPLALQESALTCWMTVQGLVDRYGCASGLWSLWVDVA